MPKRQWLNLPVICLSLLLCQSIQAESVLLGDGKLELVKDGFIIPDGPATNGSGTLYVPDVKGGALYQYQVKTKKMYPLIKAAKGEEASLRISATYFNHGKLYVSNNGESAISVLERAAPQKGQKYGKWFLNTLIQHDKTAKPPLRPNDLVVDKHGGIYYTLTPKGQVWYYDPAKGGEPIVAVDDHKTPNGLILSPDESTLYVSAFVPKEIWAYPITAPGKTAAGKVIAKMDDGPDKGADGMTIDRAGNIYCAGPAHVWVWSPSGKLLDKIETPTRPINVGFCGPDPQSLYITCMQDKKNPEKTGAIYRVATRVYGVSPTPPTDAKVAANSKKPTTYLPDSIKADMGIVYATYGDRKLLMDLYTPKASSAKPRAAIVVVHGGGWQNGDRSKFAALSIALAGRGYVVANIEYRLAKEAKFPAAIHDCNASVRYLKANSKKLNINPDLIGVAGGSAGGHLAGLMATGWKLKETQGDGGYGDYSSKLMGAVVMAGPMQISTGKVAERSISAPKANAIIWFGGNVNEQKALYELACAHRHIDKDTPPVLFLTGELDDPSKNDLSMNRLKELGIYSNTKIYPKGKHGCWNQIPWFNDFVNDIDAFFKQQIK